MNKSAVFCISIIVLSLCVFTACEKSAQPVLVPITSLLPPHQYGETPQIQESRKELQQFVINRLSGPDGIFTNYQETEQNADPATGHEVLSESAGLLMRYYALTGQQTAFDAEWERAKRTLDLGTGFSYRYSPKLKKKYTLNAAVDDLRIIRALHEAGQLFKDSRYHLEADTYGSRFYEHNIKGDYLYDFYDKSYKTTNAFITLCYIDLKTLQLLPDPSKMNPKLSANMFEILRKGYISDAFPFYETRYQYKTHSYNSDHINTVESVLTILSLAEVQQHNPASIRYLKDQVKAGTLYGQYTKDGKPANDIRSTAIYAITAMIGAQVGDKTLYEDSIRRMNEFQIHDTGSPLYGGFGDAVEQQAYSFDNLMALLAYAY